MDHVSQVGLCYRADPPNRPGGTDQSILRALSDLMPVIADQSRWDDLTQVCDPSPGLRSAGHARGTCDLYQRHSQVYHVWWILYQQHGHVYSMWYAWPCTLYVVYLAMYTLCGTFGHVYFMWYAWPCILYLVHLVVYIVSGMDCTTGTATYTICGTHLCPR